MKYILILILLASCTVSKKPQRFDFGEGLTLCHCPKDTVYKVGILKPVIDTALMKDCEHRVVRSTLMGCINSPCNTATCMDCGYSWKTY